MKEIFFITGNKEKLREICEIIPGVQGIDLDLTEIQEIDAQKVIAAKLAEAQKYRQGSALMVEDTSLSLERMHGLPGPLIKWFLKTIGTAGISQLTETFGSRATARTLIGYADEAGAMYFFAGEIKGIIIPPRGSGGFGWDSLFQPDGQDKTFAEMTPQEKQHYSMRKIAAQQLCAFLAEPLQLANRSTTSASSSLKKGSDALF